MFFLYFCGSIEAIMNNGPVSQFIEHHYRHFNAAALLDGYESVRPLSLDEAAAIAPMTALCHAEFALSEADYFLGVLHSPEQAQMASDGWLVGHARWFRSKRGRELLEALRQPLLVVHCTHPHRKPSPH